MQLLPGRAGLHVQNLMFLVEAHLVESAHVENQAVLDEGVPSHAVAGTGGGDSQLVVARELQRILNILDGGNSNDAVDRGFVQVTRVIDVAADLFEGQSLRRRNLQDQPCGLGLIRVRRINKVGFFFLGGRGGIIKKLFRGHHHQRRHEQKND